jgi:PIN domain nuclease of toxin-antitoxin system
MKLLLDTHVFLWLMSEPSKLSPNALAACQDSGNQLTLSVASIWEIQIKQQLGKLKLDVVLGELIEEQQATNGLQILSVELPHILALNELPLHHNDPFDRLLIAQARTEHAHLISADAVFSQYPVDLLW